VRGGFRWRGPTGPRKYYRARYYDPKIGRFVSEDQIGLAGGSNPYAYVGDNPTTFTDPFGLYDPSPPAGFGAGVMDMWRNYRRMQARGWSGADKYYRCMANCQATNEGPGGAAAAIVISFLRTNVRSRWTEPDDWRNDAKANKCGQQGDDCEKLCAPFIPQSSPGKPPFPGW